MPVFPRLDLSMSLAGLSLDPEAPWAGGPRAAMDWAKNREFSWVQLDAAASGLRPRELDRSGRRDLAAVLRRTGLGLSGLDLLIPAAHFADPARAERAVDATLQAIELASDMSRLLGDAGSAMVAMTLPDAPAARTQLGAHCELHGVRIADHSIPDSARPATPGIGAGLDPGALLLRGKDPASEAATAGPALAQARLSDADDTGRVPVGSGRLDPLAYMASLVAGAYTRPVVLDLRGLPDQALAAQAAASAWPGS